LTKSDLDTGRRLPYSIELIPETVVSSFEHDENSTGAASSNANKNFFILLKF
jgi:hypothetical protein